MKCARERLRGRPQEVEIPEDGRHTIIWEECHRRRGERAQHDLVQLERVKEVEVQLRSKTSTLLVLSVLLALIGPRQSWAQGRDGATQVL